MNTIVRTIDVSIQSDDFPVNLNNNNSSNKDISIVIDSFIKGDKGDAGEDGYTPVLGVDYFTKSQVNTMKNEVVSVIQDNISTSDKVFLRVTESELQELKDSGNWAENVFYYTEEEE